jgi:hypothetical protein
VAARDDAVDVELVVVVHVVDEHVGVEGDRVRLLSERAVPGKRLAFHLSRGV